MVATAAPGATTLTEQLALRLGTTVDAAARARAALLLVDWLGCALGAAPLPLARRLRALCATLPAGPCSTLGAGRRDPLSALLLNAALGNALEMDDVERGAILHPGPVAIPVALAAVQQHGGDARTVLDAIVRGYEATIRVGRALGRAHYRHWHPTSTAGAFGAAAAAASVLGLDPAGCADALGTAGSRTGGLWQMRHEPVPTKSIHNSEAACSGYRAALLAQAGLCGPRAILEGPQGLFAATAPDAQPAAVLADADGWLIHATSLKPWPACRHAHPAIDALRLLGRFDIDAVQSVEVATYAEALRFCDRPLPRTEPEAKFSLQHALAAVLLHGEPRAADFRPEALDAAPLAALRARIRPTLDAALDAAFPAHYGAEVRVTLRDGSRRVQRCTDAWGDPEWPLDIDAVTAKAVRLAEQGGHEAPAARAAIDAALALAHGGTLAGLDSALDALGPTA